MTAILTQVSIPVPTPAQLLAYKLLLLSVYRLVPDEDHGCYVADFVKPSPYLVVERSANDREVRQIITDWLRLKYPDHRLAQYWDLSNSGYDCDF